FDRFARAIAPAGGVHRGRFYFTEGGPASRPAPGRRSLRTAGARAFRRACSLRLAGPRDALQRSHVHLAIAELAGDADALADVRRQLHAVRGVVQIDRRGSFLQEPALPAALLRRAVAVGVLQPVGRVFAREAARD